MPASIPFVPSLNNYRLNVPIGPTRYLFDNVHWNSRDNAWYFDLREEDETAIVLGIKVVLGTPLGGHSPHPFFADNLIQAIDTAGIGRDAGFDELGDRVKVTITTSDEVQTSPS